MSTPSKSELEQEFFELVCYMVSSARNLVPEPKLYGPFRLIDAVSRLIDILRRMGLASPRLETIQRQVEEGKYSVMESEEKFTTFMENLVMSLVPLMDERKGKT